MQLIKFGFESVIFFALLISIPIQLICLIFILNNNSYKDPVQKLLWVMVVWFIPVFGWLFYLFIGRKRN